MDVCTSWRQSAYDDVIPAFLVDFFYWIHLQSALIGEFSNLLRRKRIQAPRAKQICISTICVLFQDHAEHHVA